MKLTLCVIVLCFYLTLSEARTIPDINDWENDADRTSHDSLHADQYVPHVPGAVWDPAELVWNPVELVWNPAELVWNFPRGLPPPPPPPPTSQNPPPPPPARYPEVHDMQQEAPEAIPPPPPVYI